MPSAESVSPRELIVCACEERKYTAQDAIDAALFRSELTAPWREFMRRVVAASRAEELDLPLDEEAFDAAAEAFRYQHDLITAEETEQWLLARGLTLADFSDYFARQIWGDRQVEGVREKEISYLSAPADLRDMFTIDLILSGQLDQMTTQLSWRLAALCAEKTVDDELIAAEKRSFLEREGVEMSQLRRLLEQLDRDEAWLDRCAAMESAYGRHREAVLVPQAYHRELVSLRLPLTRFETEVIELESRDAAQEALFCAREDGISMEEVASEGRYPYRRLDFVLEDLGDELQQKFLSVSDGQIIEPMPHGDGFELCRVIRKIEPQADDPAIQSRIEQLLLNRHFSDLARKHVDLLLTAAAATQ